MKHKKILFILGIFSLLVVGYISLDKNKSIEFNDVKLSYSEYNSAREAFKDHVGFRVCDLENGNCVLFTDIDNYKEYLNNN